MRKTTISVATLLAVAATPSFAAVQVANSAGQAFTIEEGKTHGSIEIALKEGTYKVSLDGFYFRGVDAESGDLLPNLLTAAAYAAAPNAEFADVYQFAIGKKGLTVKITAYREAGAPNEDDQQVVKIVPVTEAFTKLQTSYNERISVIFNNVDKLADDDAFAAKRAKLLDEISAYQDKVKEMGLEEYNDWMDNGKTLPEFDEAIESLEGDADNAVKNVAAYAELQTLADELSAEFDSEADPKGLKQVFAAVARLAGTLCRGPYFVSDIEV